jgi:hypothetical protein
MTNDDAEMRPFDISTNKFADNPYPEFRENQWRRRTDRFDDLRGDQPSAR